MYSTDTHLHKALQSVTLLRCDTLHPGRGQIPAASLIPAGLPRFRRSSAALLVRTGALVHKERRNHSRLLLMGANVTAWTARAVPKQGRAPRSDLRMAGGEREI